MNKWVASFLVALLLTAAYGVGYDSGKDAGYQSGYSTGFEESRESAYNEGFAEGQIVGYDVGYNAASKKQQTATNNNSTGFKSALDRLNSIEVEERKTNPNDTVVYVTNTGNKYHKASCEYLYSSKTAIGRTAAVSKGYTPCPVCW